MNQEQGSKISWADRSVHEVEPVPILQFSENEVSSIQSERDEINENLVNVNNLVSV